MVKSLHRGKIATGVIQAKTARQVWEDLLDQFRQKNAPTIFQNSEGNSNHVPRYDVSGFILHQTQSVVG